MAEKQKFHIEYLVKASLEMLYQYISTASGLAEWFCDAASSKGNQFTFVWAGSEEQATLIARREDSLVRFRWAADEGEKYYFEIRLEQDELTGDVAMTITDFAYPGEVDEMRQMWNTCTSTFPHKASAKAPAIQNPAQGSRYGRFFRRKREKEFCISLPARR